MPLVSVIIPCYNAVRFLDATLASAEAQSGVDVEFIVVDDGSTDDSRNHIAAWQSKLGERLRVHLGPNRGASAARNTGTAMARGEFIQYLDADDVLRPNTLSERVRALRGGADVAYCDWQRLEENASGDFTAGEVVSRTMESVHPRPEIALFTHFWAPPAALLYRRSIVDAIGGWNVSLPIIQDARFALDAALAGARFQHVPRVGADYRMLRGSSLSSRDPLAFVMDCYTNACQIEDRCRLNRTLDDDWRKAIALSYHYTARALFLGKHPAFATNMERLYEIEPGFRLSYAKVANSAARCLGMPAAHSFMRMLLGARAGIRTSMAMFPGAR